MRVLVADDDPVSQRILLATLTHLGHEAAVADDGQRHQWRVVGWRRSGEQCRHIAQMLAAGIVPPPDLPVDGR